jgi:hypothetical protein
MKKMIISIITMFFLFSCHNNTFESILFRTTEDPFEDVPLADSLTLEHTVYLSWKEDKGADIFRLMRSNDNTELSFTCIYEGKEKQWKDTNLTNGCRYIYRLDKTRGNQYFQGQTYAYGFSSDCRKDIYECNDTEQEATLLEYDRICNLPCIRYTTGKKEVIDCDWFYVTIPPRRAADIIVNQHSLSTNPDGTPTKLRIQIAGFESNIVLQQKAYIINNTSYETKNYYFKIYPETTEFFSQGNGYAVIEYTVSLNQIHNLKL